MATRKPIILADGLLQQLQPGDSLEGITSGDAYYRHVQGSPVTTIVVTHNLGKRPSVTVVDSAGTVIEGDVEYLAGDNDVRLTFTAPFSFEAYFN